MQLPVPKIVDKETRRLEIVDAATRVFAARGYHLARMEDVAAELGISKGLLYSYFETKEDLFMQVCLSLVPWEGLQAEDADPERRLRALLEAVVAKYEEAHNFFLILSDFWTAAMRGPNAKRAALRATGAQFYVPVRAALVATIRAGQRAGVFAAGADAPTLANVAIAAIEGVRLQHELDPGAARKTRVVAAVTDLVLRELTHAQASRGKGPRAPVASRAH
jgi:AcrR family transcriptional regulator